MTSETIYDWNELAFKSKKPLKELKATFIAAPRDISTARFKQILKENLAKAPIVLGLAKEVYIDGFEGQPHFKTLQLADIEKLIKLVNQNSKHKVYVLHYFQRDLEHIVEKIPFKKILFVNGSWLHAFHNKPIYYQLVQQNVSYQLISAFVDEKEAVAYQKLQTKPLRIFSGFEKSKVFNDAEAIKLTNQVANASYDYNFQTGAVLAKKATNGYKVLLTAHNKVVPFETYALLHGASREQHFSAPHDLNHYDTVHAEVELLLQALKAKVDLNGTSLFINLLPCPSCSRMLVDTDVKEVVYQNDHSDGYAVKLLEEAGKTVRRVVI